MVLHFFTLLLFLFAFVRMARAAATTPTCDTLGIPADVDCREYCGTIGYDGVTAASAHGSIFYRSDEFGSGCKCKTSPPGTQFDVHDYELICITPPPGGWREKPSSPDASVENASASNFTMFEIDCDKVGIDCNGGSSIGDNGVTMVSFAASVAAIALAFLP